VITPHYCDIEVASISCICVSDAKWRLINENMITSLCSISKRP
jgi:hypothetical protein